MGSRCHQSQSGRRGRFQNAGHSSFPPEKTTRKCQPLSNAAQLAEVIARKFSVSEEKTAKESQKNDAYVLPGRRKDPFDRACKVPRKNPPTTSSWLKNFVSATSPISWQSPKISRNKFWKTNAWTSTKKPSKTCLKVSAKPGPVTAEMSGSSLSTMKTRSIRPSLN